MVDFSQLKALDVSPDTTAEYRFPYIAGNPSLILAPAHDSNEAFYDERLRIAIEDSKKDDGARPGEITVESMKAQAEEDRERDRKLLSRTCARSWGKAPVDVGGKTVEFTPENCYEFFRQMPAWMFDPLRNWSANLYNFVKRPPVDEAEAERLGNE